MDWSPSISTPNDILRTIRGNYLRYSSPPSGISRTSLRNALDGKNIERKTYIVLRNFVRYHYRDFLFSDHKEFDIPNLGPLFRSFPDAVAKIGKKVEGLYQSYAYSTSVRGAMRRGSFEFKYSEFENQIFINERQSNKNQPNIDSPLEIEAIGTCTPINRFLYGVMGSINDLHFACPLFYIFMIDDVELSKDQVMSITAVSLGFDPSNRMWPSFPTIYLKRCEREDDVCIDFCKPTDVESNIRDKLPKPLWSNND